MATVPTASCTLVACIGLLESPYVKVSVLPPGLVTEVSRFELS